MRRFAIALVCGLMLAGLVSCGGDDEKATETVPTVTTETETTATTDTTPTATTPAPTTPTTTPAPPPADNNSGGTPAPGDNPRTAPQDGPDNDIPPEPGSPAERFERQCEQNPQTCGD
jgi:hypothetical protein